MATRQKSLVLILARDLASKLATPVLIVDADGYIVYFNEAAERVVGESFVETHELGISEWAKAFEPHDEEGNRIPLSDLPMDDVLRRRVPSHRSFRIRGADGVDRRIEATAFPMYARADEFVGGLAVFWESSEER